MRCRSPVLRGEDEVSLASSRVNEILINDKARDFNADFVDLLTVDAGPSLIVGLDEV